MARFAIAYSGPMRVLLGALGLSGAFVEVGGSAIEVRMGWAFYAQVPRQNVNAAARSDRSVRSQGVHGRDGRWLVNGATRGLVRIDLAPGQEARVLGRRVPLSTLEVSMEDPDALVTALSTPTDGEP